MTELKEKYVQELITTDDGTEGSHLIPRRIYDTLIEEVPKNLIPRSEAAIYFGPSAIPGSSVDIDLEDENKMSVRLTAEGGEIALDKDEYESINIKPLKYGVAIKITKEMQEDSKWPLLERNVRKAGKRFSENETNLILTELQSCSNSVSGGASITNANITAGMEYVEDSDYEPTSMLVGNEVMTDLRNIDSFTEYNKSGDQEMLRTGFRGIIHGMQVMRYSTNAAPSSTYKKYAYIYDRNEAYAIAEKRPVTVENFMLPNFDMSGAAVTQRIAAKILRDNAICRISTS